METKVNNHFRENRKIDPSQGLTLGDKTPNNKDRVEIGPTKLAYSEWQKSGLALPDLPRMREFRWRRLTDYVVQREYGLSLIHI